MDTVLFLLHTRRGPCQHGFMCGCEQWSNNISESNYNMQPITIQFAVRVGPYVRTIHMPLACLSGRCLGYAVTKLIEIRIIVVVIYVNDNT